MKKYITGQITLWFIIGVVVISALEYILKKPDLSNLIEVLNISTFVLFSSAIFSIATTYGLKLSESKLGSFGEPITGNRIFSAGITFSTIIFIAILTIHNFAMPSIKTNKHRDFASIIKRNPTTIIYDSSPEPSPEGNIVLKKSTLYTLRGSHFSKIIDTVIVSPLGEFTGKHTKATTLVNPANLIKWSESVWKFSIWDYFSAVDDLEISGLYTRGVKFATYWKITFPVVVLGVLLLSISVFWKRRPTLPPPLLYQINFTIIAFAISVITGQATVNLLKGIYSFVAVALL